MKRIATRSVLIAAIALGLVMGSSGSADACSFDADCASVGIGAGIVTVTYSGTRVGDVAARSPAEVVNYEWRLLPPCILAAELGDSPGLCAATAAPCPPEPGRVIQYLIVQRRPVVRLDGTAVVPVAAGLAPGSPVGNWSTVREGCVDITALNPPPSPARSSPTSCGSRCHTWPRSTSRRDTACPGCRSSSTPTPRPPRPSPSTDGHGSLTCPDMAHSRPGLRKRLPTSVIGFRRLSASCAIDVPSAPATEPFPQHARRPSPGGRTPTPGLVPNPDEKG